MAQVIHWELCEKCRFDWDKNCYNHEPKSVCESPNSKLLWDFKIQTDNKIGNNKPDIVVLDKIELECVIIDAACPFDTRESGKPRVPPRPEEV